VTFWDKASKFPPILVRLLARHKPNGKPITNKELSAITKWSELRVAALSEQMDWAGVDIPTMRVFLRACRMDFEDAKAMKRVDAYMRGYLKNGTRVPPRFSHLQNHPLWAAEFKPLSDRFFYHAANQIKP
jgi:hypothetical protein